jgi:hypothetical protein
MVFGAVGPSLQKLFVDHSHWPVRSFEVIQQASVDGDAARLATPGASGSEVQAVRIEIAAASSAKVIVYGPAVPAIDRVAIGSVTLNFAGGKYAYRSPRFEQKEQVQRISRSGSSRSIPKMLHPQ